MYPWIIPTKCAIGTLVVTYPGFCVVHMLESQEKRRTDYYLSIRIEDVPAAEIANHVEKISRELRFSSEWVEPKVRAAHAEFPEGTIFFYNTSEEQWRRLGGEAGYAILLNGRIVWKRRIAIS
jgi:hypothetical protein